MHSNFLVTCSFPLHLLYDILFFVSLYEVGQASIVRPGCLACPSRYQPRSPCNCWSACVGLARPRSLSKVVDPWALKNPIRLLPDAPTFFPFAEKKNAM